MAATVAIALVASAVLAAPGAALTADATVDDPAPGAVGDYTVTLRPEEGDAIARNGLKQVTLDFGADRDYSGDLGNLSARDVEVRVGDENGTVWAGQTSVNRSGTEVTITLEQAFSNVRPGDRIVVRVFGVTNTEIALRNPQTLRGFALRASATGPQGNTSGPVEARYAIDPNATARQTPTDEASGSGGNDSNGNDSANDTDTDTETAATAVNTTETNTTEGTSTDTATSMENASTTAATGTPEMTETSTTQEATDTATTDGGEGGGGGQATETTGPGFGLLVALVALLAAGLLATRRRD